MRKMILMASAALAACTPMTAEEAPAPAAPAAVVASQTGWAAFRDAFIEGWFEIDPANAVYQGRHDFDGRLPD